MKKINYISILLFCFCLTFCSTDQSDLDGIACKFVEATIHFDKNTLLELASESNQIEINKEFKDLESQGILKQLSSEIEKCKISTKVTERDINEKGNFAVITVKLKIESEQSLEIEMLIPFRNINGHWLVVNL